MHDYARLINIDRAQWRQRIPGNRGEHIAKFRNRQLLKMEVFQLTVSRTGKLLGGAILAHKPVLASCFSQQIRNSGRGVSQGDSKWDIPSPHDAHDKRIVCQGI